ncbi:unnamed protein product, partial [Laminaria digitata]
LTFTSGGGESVLEAPAVCCEMSGAALKTAPQHGSHTHSITPVCEVPRKHPYFLAEPPSAPNSRSWCLWSRVPSPLLDARVPTAMLTFRYSVPTCPLALAFHLLPV